MKRLNPSVFFDADPRDIAPLVLGKLISHHYMNTWLTCRIIDVEAYLLTEKGSHASLGYTPKRQALFAKPGTIYMYYARGNDSFNISCRGDGNALLIKSAYPFVREVDDEIRLMQELNKKGNKERKVSELCAGQTLLCKSLNLKVTEWDNKQFENGKLELLDDGYQTECYIVSRRLGIPKGRDEDLMYRYTDFNFARNSTNNPLRKGQIEKRDYYLNQVLD
ncbi:MAG: DNA-3-methyladenine glycosylase [Calditrichaeota bacterium]|nr:DNA-3-methyladenine glycosylase [Calditrichota bacterium]